MKIPVISSFTQKKVSNQNNSENNQNNISLASKPDTFSPSFGHIVDGVEEPCDMYGNNFIEHLDAMVKRGRINNQQKQLMLDACAISKDKINDLTLSHLYYPAHCVEFFVGIDDFEIFGFPTGFGSPRIDFVVAPYSPNRQYEYRKYDVTELVKNKKTTPEQLAEHMIKKTKDTLREYAERENRESSTTKYYAALNDWKGDYVPEPLTDKQLFSKKYIDKHQPSREIYRRKDDED